MIAISGKAGRVIPFFAAIVLFSCFLLQDAAAQNTPPGPATPPRPGNVPSRPSPGRPGQVKEAPPAKEPLPSKGPNRSLEELELARKRRLEKLRRLAEEESKKAIRVPPVLPKLPWSATFQPPGKNDLDISSTWKIKAGKGKRPFTLLTVRIKNRTNSYLSLADLLLDGERLTPLDKKDKRMIPDFPMRLNRFADEDRMPGPVPPRGTRTLTFAFPFALDRKSKLNTLAGKYYKFLPASKVEWDPVRVVGWEVVDTMSRGQNHQGLLVTVKNRADYPVTVKLMADLAEATFAGGETLFLSEVTLQAKERKRMIFRSIPDEGAASGSTERDARPDNLRIRSITVADIQF